MRLAYVYGNADGIRCLILGLNILASKAFMLRQLEYLIINISHATSHNFNAQQATSVRQHTVGSVHFYRKYVANIKSVVVLVGSICFLVI